MKAFDKPLQPKKLIEDATLEVAPTRGSGLSRRAMLASTLGGMAALATGCAVLPGSAASSTAPRVTRRLAVPRIAPERIIRTTAGLRPYRAPGFVVRTDRLDEKVVVHNYGHGGGGISLSWGSSQLAAELATETEHRRAAVVGAGIMGLTTARLLQDRGFDVTVYARELPPYTTSNMSGGQWNPTSVFSFAEASPAFHRQFSRAANFAWRHYQNLVGPLYGVRWVENYVLLNSPPPESTTSMRTLLPEVFAETILLGPGQHPFPSPYAQRYTTMLVEPAVLLDTLSRDILLRGGRILHRDFRDRAELTQLEEPLLLNCTGLGAAALFDDPELLPIKGQLAVLVPDPAVDYIAQLGSWYMFPRSDGIILGGTYERGEWTTHNDPDAIARIVEGNSAIFEGMRSSTSS